MRSITMWRYLSWVTLVAVVACVCGEASGAEERSLARFEYTQMQMGVQARIVLYAPDEKSAVEAARDAFQRYSDLDQTMSDYRSTSELMQLCARAGGPPVKVSEDLFRVLERAERVSRESDGAFDVTVGPLVSLWRRARKTGTLPPAAEIAAARRLVGWHAIRLNKKDRTVRLMVRGMKLDLGGIAKGYADDCAQEVLKRHGIRSALIEAGGDIVVTNAPPGKPGWLIEVANPGVGERKQMLTLANCAISSSGDTEQFVVIEGKRYSHVVDPHTGLGLTDRVEGTVIGPDGLTTDSLSTAVCVLGAAKGEALAAKYPGVKAYIRKAAE